VVPSEFNLVSFPLSIRLCGESRTAEEEPDAEDENRSFDSRVVSPAGGRLRLLLRMLCKPLFFVAVAI
jgi:hypothetical protein